MIGPTSLNQGVGLTGVVVMTIAGVGVTGVVVTTIVGAGVTGVVVVIPTAAVVMMIVPTTGVPLGLSTAPLPIVAHLPLRPLQRQRSTCVN